MAPLFLMRRLPVLPLALAASVASAGCDPAGPDPAAEQPQQPEPDSSVPRLTLERQVNSSQYLPQNIAFSPDGRWLAVALGRSYQALPSPGRVAVFDATAWDQPPQALFYGVYDVVFNGVAFSPDSRFLVATGWDRSVFGGILAIWELANWTLVAEDVTGRYMALSAAFLSPESFVVTTGDSVMHVYKHAGGRWGRELTVDGFDAANVRYAVASPDNRWVYTTVVVGNDDPDVTHIRYPNRIWDVADWTGRYFYTYDLGGDFSPDNDILVTGDNGPYGTGFRITEVGTWLDLGRRESFIRVTALRFSDDGNWLATSGHPNCTYDCENFYLELWRVSGRSFSLDKRVPLGPGFVAQEGSIAFSPDGRWLAIASAVYPLPPLGETRGILRVFELNADP